MVYYLNNNFIKDNFSSIDVRDRGFLLGDGVFTTIKSISGKLISFSNHIERLNANAATIKINLCVNIENVEDICKRLLIENCLEKQAAIIRITITRGASGRGVNIPLFDKQDPTLLIRVMPYQNSMNDTVKVCTTSMIRSEKSILAKIKSLNYLESILARDEAVRNGCEEGLMLNSQGNIVSGAVSNIFLLHESGYLVTPPVTDGALPGITRHTILSICQEVGVSINEQSISPHTLKLFRAGFITNSAIGIKSIKEVDGQKFSVSEPIIQKIVNEYAQLVSS